MKHVRHGSQIWLQLSAASPTNRPRLKVIIQIVMGFPYRTLDPDPMRIRDLYRKTNLPPQGFNPDPSCVLCCVTVLRDRT